MTKFLSLPGSADGSVNNKDGFKLSEGFKLAYLALLEAIAANNGQMIGKITEPLMHHEFNHGFQKLNYEFKEIQLLNKEDFTFDLRVIDWQQYFGANISREDNRLRALRKIATRRKNFSGYVPDDVGYGEVLSTNFMFVLRVETNLKLNLVDFEGRSLIDVSDTFDVMRPEVHFM